MTKIDFPQDLPPEEQERIKNEFADNVAYKIKNPIDHKAIPQANA